MTFAKAYSLAQPGDVILVGNGSYNSNETVCRGGALPPCPRGQSEKGTTPITFEAETPHGPVVNGLVQLGNPRGGGDNPPSYVTFDGIDVNGQVVENGFNTSSPKATNITIENGHMWEVQEYRDPGIPVIENSQIDNMTIENEEIGPICCQGDALGGGLASSSVPVNMTVDHSSIHDLYDSCKYVPSSVNSQYGPCDTSGNKGFGDGGGGDHVDGIQMWGANGLNLTNDRWWAIGANGDPVGQTIFLEGDPTGVGGYYKNVLIENNMIYAGGTGNNTVSMDKSGGSVPDSGYVKILYNTVWGDGNGNIALYSGTFASNTTVDVVGNIARYGTGCTISAYGGGTITVNENHNEWQNSTLCASTDHKGAPTFITANALNPDEDLSGSQWAINSGDSVFCPSQVPTDIHGTARPDGSACDVGADEAG